jgi:ribose transport system permease protein
MSIARGLAFLCSGGRGIVLPVGTVESVARFAALGSSVGGFPVQGAVFLALAAGAWLVLGRTAVGRHVYALGGNAEAARLSGVRVGRVQLLVYAVSGLLAGVAGVIHVATLRNGHPAEGIGWELNAIAATVLGGTHLSGGRGSVAGAAAGAVFIGVLNNLLGLRNVDPYVQMLLKGALILAAVLVQRRGVDRIPPR